MNPAHAIKFLIFTSISMISQLMLKYYINAATVLKRNCHVTPQLQLQVLLLINPSLHLILFQYRQYAKVETI